MASHKAAGLRDYGRVDVRLAHDHEIYVVEANPNCVVFDVLRATGATSTTFGLVGTTAQTLVKGVGLKTVEKNRDRIVVGNVAGAGKGTAGRPMTKTAARPTAKR